MRMPAVSEESFQSGRDDFFAAAAQAARLHHGPRVCGLAVWRARGAHRLGIGRDTTECSECPAESPGDGRFLQHD